MSSRPENEGISSFTTFTDAELIVNGLFVLVKEPPLYTISSSLFVSILYELVKNGSIALTFVNSFEPKNLVDTVTCVVSCIVFSIFLPARRYII